MLTAPLSGNIYHGFESSLSNFSTVLEEDGTESADKSSRSHTAGGGGEVIFWAKFRCSVHLTEVFQLCGRSAYPAAETIAPASVAHMRLANNLSSFEKTMHPRPWHQRRGAPSHMLFPVAA